MTEQQADELIEKGEEHVGKELPVHFTNQKGKIERSSTCEVMDSFVKTGIGINDEEKSYSVSVGTKEKNTGVVHPLPLKEVVDHFERHDS